MDFGLHNTVGRAALMQVSADGSVLQTRQACLDALNHRVRELDQRADKQAFLEATGHVFQQPQLFEFQPHRGDDVRRTVSEFCIAEFSILAVVDMLKLTSSLSLFTDTHFLPGFS